MGIEPQVLEHFPRGGDPILAGKNGVCTTVDILMSQLPGIIRIVSKGASQASGDWIEQMKNSLMSN
jgi:hypothetical protein